MWTSCSIEQSQPTAVVHDVNHPTVTRYVMLTIAIIPLYHTSKY